MTEDGEVRPSDRGRLARSAERLFALLNDHPVLKLLAVLWIIGTSIWVPIDSLRRERAEARRAGWNYVPSVRLQLGASGRCELTNSGERPIVEATLHWKEYYIDATDCRPPLTLFDAVPAAEARDLMPRGQLAIDYLEDRRKRTCHNVRATPTACAPGHDCHIVVACEALYHRAADIQPFTQAQFMLLEGGCTSLVPLKTLVVLRGGRLEWKDARSRSAWRCLKEQRAKLRPPMQQLDEFNATVDGLLQRE